MPRKITNIVSCEDKPLNYKNYQCDNHDYMSNEGGESGAIAVNHTAVSLQCVNDVHGGNCMGFAVFSVG